MDPPKSVYIKISVGSTFLMLLYVSNDTDIKYRNMW